MTFLSYLLGRMLRQICEQYPKVYKSPQTRIKLIMIGHNSASFVVLCVNVWTPVDKMQQHGHFVCPVTAYGAAMREPIVHQAVLIRVMNNFSSIEGSGYTAVNY